MIILNQFLFSVLPYIAIAIFIIGFIYRYFSKGYSVTSLSSQFLEGKTLYWGSMPFHWGLLVVFLGHMLAIFFPNVIIYWNSEPIRLALLEITGFIFGLTVFWGLIILFNRRIRNDRIRVVTTRMDIVLEILLIAQVLLGLWTAIGYRWGSTWFATDLSPYLMSLLHLEPKIDAVSAMPLVVKLHITGAYLLILLIPFTRLIHFMVFPIHYLFGPYQKVMWNWNFQKIRKPESEWTMHRPKNN